MVGALESKEKEEEEGLEKWFSFMYIRRKKILLFHKNNVRRK